MNLLILIGAVISTLGAFNSYIFAKKYKSQVDNHLTELERRDGYRIEVWKSFFLVLTAITLLAFAF